MGKALSVALFIGLAMHIAPPMPGQQAGTISKGSDKAAEDRQGNKSAASPPITAPALQSKDSRNKGQGVAAEDKEQAVKLTSIPTITLSDRKKTWVDYAFDWGPWVFSLILVFVGILGICAAMRTLRAIERQATLQAAFMTQWVSVVNWKAALIQRTSPLSQEPKLLRIDFDIVNPSNFPLTLTGIFRFNGTLPGAPQVIITSGIVLPNKPLTVGADVLMTDEQAKNYIGEGTRISLHGEYSHIGPSKERSPTMEIHANIVCRSGQPTVSEYESTNEKQDGQQPEAN